jgi:hypothetical protein
MKVKELIEQLSKYDPELDIVIPIIVSNGTVYYLTVQELIRYKDTLVIDYPNRYGFPHYVK